MQRPVKGAESLTLQRDSSFPHMRTGGSNKLRSPSQNNLGQSVSHGGSDLPLREAKKQLYSEKGRHPDYEEVAKAAGLSMKRLAAVMLTPKALRSLDQNCESIRASSLRK
uniref:RNA polymerase sigma-70 region 3 domain-containing protein n=1 Tax=Ananas comosus var. bracteatus TaxID=296719 RepID=A0A6V7NXC3_ANACO|nr:unnamed protein product [Ananas comosus var. bracteatus]